MTTKPKSARGDWAKQLRFDMAFAEKALCASGSLTAMFIVHTKGSGAHVLAAPWTDDEEKDRCCELVCLYCIANDAHALTFISEVWMRRMQRHPRETEAEFEARTHAVEPRDAEDGTEAVLVCVTWRDAAGERQTLFEAREIVRRANGKPDGLAPMTMGEDYTGLGGRMFELLPDRAPSALEQAAARVLLSRLGADRL
jgi:hypothetical protein